jgi:hypothetical protein
MVAQQEPEKIAEEALQKLPGEMGEVRRNQSRLWRILDRKIAGALRALYWYCGYPPLKGCSWNCIWDERGTSPNTPSVVSTRQA